MNDPKPFKRKVRIQYDEIARACKNKQEPSKMDLLDWVFNHVGPDPTHIRPDDYPCVGAARMLVEANKDYRAFLAIWAKTIPTQTQLKLADRPKDDGRILGIFQALEQHDASPQGTKSEHGVSEKDSETGGGEPERTG